MDDFLANAGRRNEVSPRVGTKLISTSLHFLLQLREHLAKGQRTLAGEGMSQIVRSLLELLQRRSYYSGDLLFSTEILRNVTDTFKRATYIPAPDDVQVRPLPDVLLDRC